MKYPQKSNTKKYLLALLAVLLLAGSVYAYVAIENQRQSETQQDESEINFGPPTEEEQRAGDAAKDRIEQEREATSDEADESQESDSAKSSATVIITDAGQYDNVIEVRAFVSNHVQDGTCSYLFTRNNQTIEKSLPAHADASSTICPMLEVPRSEFPTAGEWQLVVSYDSTEARGSSETKTVTIN